MFDEEWMAFKRVKGAGRLTAYVPGVVLPLVYTEPQIADFYAEFDVRAVEAQQDSTYGLVYRRNETQDGAARYYALGLQPAANAITFSAWVDPDWVLGEAVPLPDGLLATGKANHVRVEAVGDNFRVFVNDVYIFERSDATLNEPGQLGFYLIAAESLGDGEQESVYFDNLRVYAPSTAASPTPEPTEKPTAQPTAAPTEEPTVEPTPQPTASLGGILFQDDFNPPSGSWWTGADENGEVRTTDGELRVRNLTVAPDREDTTPGITAADVVIEVQSRLVDGSANNWQSVFCRHQGTSDYAFAYSADGYYTANVWVDGERVRTSEATQTDAVRQGKDAVNQVKVSCIGSRLRFWLNGTLLIDWEDDRLNEGEFGVSVTSLAEEYSEAAFDNFVAYAGVPGASATPAATLAATPAATRNRASDAASLAAVRQFQ